MSVIGYMYRTHPYARSGIGMMLDAYGAFWPAELERALEQARMLAYASHPPRIVPDIAAAVDAFAARLAVIQERIEAGDETAREELPPGRDTLQSDIAYLHVYAKELRGEDVLA